MLAAEIGIGATAAAITLPYLSVAGLGNFDYTQQLLNLCKSSVVYGTGLAGTINEGMATIPGIGEGLAAGGWVNAVSSGILGIGGTLLGNYVTKHYDRHGHVPWGKIIKYTCLATSILIALPSLLSGVSMGITYLAMLTGGAAVASAVAAGLSDSLGLMGGITLATAGAGLAGLFSHFLTCGAALVPAASALLIDKPQAHAHEGSAYMMKLLSHPPCVKGKPCRVEFQLIDTASGRVMDTEELATLHTKKLHTMIVDSGLSDYHHIHPDYDAARNVFSCGFTPKTQATYAMWNDFTIAGDSQPTQVKTELAMYHAQVIAPRITPTNNVQVEGLNFRIATDPRLRQAQSGMLRVEVTDTDGRPVADLQPIMGAYAHLAGFSADGQHFIHSHPLGIQPENEQSRGVGHLQFHITPGMAGMNKFFLQVQRDGQTLTVPFGQLVAPALGHAARMENMPHHHAGMAMA